MGIFRMKKLAAKLEGFPAGGGGGDDLESGFRGRSRSAGTEEAAADFFEGAFGCGKIFRGGETFRLQPAEKGTREGAGGGVPVSGDEGGGLRTPADGEGEPSLKSVHIGKPVKNRRNAAGICFENFAGAHEEVALVVMAEALEALFEGFGNPGEVEDAEGVGRGEIFGAVPETGGREAGLGGVFPGFVECLTVARNTLRGT
jgi:hypothetical protein